MNVSGSPVSYKGLRFPQEVIAHAVWLYHRFPLSFRDVEELLYAPGVTVRYETVRQWYYQFGREYANGLRQRCRSAGRRGDSGV